MKIIAVLAAYAAAATAPGIATYAQPAPPAVTAGLDGYWSGEAIGQDQQSHIILRVTTGADGTQAVLDLPDALATDVPALLTREGEAVRFSVPALNAQFEGRLDPQAGALAGTFGSPGGSATLTLVRRDQGGPRRTQTPIGPLPYRTEQFTFANPSAPDVRLGCTLTLPEGAGPHPLAYLLTGTGQQDRDESLVGHRPFLVLADHLARNGVASLRCDDRGIGQSTGAFRTASLDDFASDVAAGMDALQARAEIDSRRMGLLGHSEGGIVAAMVAARRTDVAFMIQLAGPGIPIAELLVLQGEAAARAQGLPDATVEQQSALNRAIFAAALAADGPAAMRAAVEEFLVAQGLPPETARAVAARATRPDILRILRIDPAPLLRQVSAPVLAMLGTKDVQVPAVQNLPALRSALAGNRDAVVVELQDLNHLFQTARTGAPGEYYFLEETMSPLALGTITAWLRDRGFADGASRD